MVEESKRDGAAATMRRIVAQFPRVLKENFAIALHQNEKLAGSACISRVSGRRLLDYSERTDAGCHAIARHVFVTSKGVASNFS
jgi:hypothetical protein